jgi:hypothetical protein
MHTFHLALQPYYRTDVLDPRLVAIWTIFGCEYGHGDTDLIPYQVIAARVFDALPLCEA